MNRVSVITCKDYDEVLLRKKINKLFDLLGGLDTYIKPGQRVLLKVNLLMEKPPEAMVTTHPAVVKVIAEMVREAGAHPIIGDSPGGPFTRVLLERAYRKSGLARVAEETGAELNFNLEQVTVPFDGVINKSFVLGKYIKEADLIINIAKLKTHGLTMMTGAVKNLFGSIPGLLKAEYHLRMPDLTDFSNMLVDLSLCVNPVLNVIDGVWGMEGEGPSAGIRRNFGYLLASPSPHALDVAAAHILGIMPEHRAPIINAARERGLPSSLEEITLLGEPLIPAEKTKIPPPVRFSNLLDRRLPGPIARTLSYLLRPRPVFISELCVGCGDCYRSCPPQVINMRNKKAEVSLDGCIRCFCCQELCQYQAVKIKRPLLGRVLTR